DQVAVEIALADHLGIDTFASAMGGSMGAMRALEWLIMQPGRVRSAMLSATAAVASADQIATNTTQIRAITGDPHWNHGDYYGQAIGPVHGMQLARQIAHINYRTEYELATRFGTDPQEVENPYGPEVPGRHADAGRFSVQSYLDHHGVKLAKRFDAGTYVALTDVMNTHDIARGRGTVADVLGSIDVPVVVSGIDSDRLFPLYQQEQLANLIPSAQSLRVVHSPYGHDSFLIENEKIGALVQETLSYVS
ncbi:MAG: alpha/beta fold hydrolase, partial [Actinobacteria bacterium]|nr:alpha/beta fold hydrolase [Actinomycetota bacterium]